MYDASILPKSEPLQTLHLGFVLHALELLFQYRKGYLACHYQPDLRLGLELL